LNQNKDQGFIEIRRALISAWRKEPAVELARRLEESGVEIVASGGTADAITAAGIPVERLSSVTGFDELLGGRVKTLHPAVHAGILALRDDPGHIADLEHAGIKPIDLVAVDLYPFPMRDDRAVDLSSAVELIDVGGVAMLRAAAKNFRYVAVLSRAEQFASAADALKAGNGRLSADFCRELAVEAFRWTADYDAAIAARLAFEVKGESPPDRFGLRLRRAIELRYGENPHQLAGFYVSDGDAPTGIAAAERLGGKRLSFNNLLDIDIALRLPREFDQPAAAILKHTTPCGVGIGDDLRDAFLNARSTDPQSAFGGIVGLNRRVNLETAQAIREGFMEVVVAPGFEEEALKELKRSKNLRIMEMTGSPSSDEYDVRSVCGGFLLQRRDAGFPELDDFRVVTGRQPDAEQLAALRFAWIVVRYVKSNAVLLAESRRTVGIGAGQMSRVDAAHLAVWKAGQAGLDTAGTVAASDAFFPFRDGLDVLADAGVTAVVQPGGSVRDEEVINAADERGIAMVFTGRRHFRH